MTNSKHLRNNIMNKKAIKSEWNGIGSEHLKVVLLWTERSGCTCSIKEILYHMGLLNDAISYHHWIHQYRSEQFLRHAKYMSMKQIRQNKYTVIKTIINPYSRAVSIFHMKIPGRSDETFRQWIKKLAHGGFGKMKKCEASHSRKQYTQGEKDIVTHYLKIDKGNEVNFIASDGSEHTFCPYRFTSSHHAKKIDCTDFVGDKLRSEIQGKIPKSYKCFYDDEIRSWVEKVYADDILNYGYHFDELL